MTQIIATTDVASGVRITLAAADDVLIAPGATLGSTDSTAIIGSYSNHYVYIEGAITAASIGIELGDDANLDSSEQILVEAGGSITCFGNAVMIFATDTSIENRGKIWGATDGIYAFGNGLGSSALTNAGTIEGGACGVFRAGSEDFAIHNSGTVAGGTQAFAASGAGDVFIDNTGKMSGLISFDAGNDTYDGHAGRHDAASNIDGGSGNDTLTGGIDDDYMLGSADDDNLYGNAGNDTLNGGSGLDHMFGGLGNDAYAVIDTGDVVSEVGGGGLDQVTSFISLSLSNTSQVIGAVENLNLVASAVTGTGNALANGIVGNASANTLTGLGGNDRLDGQGGGDKLIGGLGNDTLTGGQGGDRFVFNTALGPSANRDTITDFAHGVDKFQLENAVFKALGAAGGLHAGFFHAGTAAADADDHIIYDRATGHLFYDSNGDAAGGSTLFAVLSSKPLLSALDFVVI